MKTFVRFTFWGLGLATMAMSIMLVGCGSKDGGGTPAVVPGVVGVVGPTAVTCAANQVNTAYGCLYVNSCQNGYGWLPGQGQCVPSITSPSTSQGGNYVASLSVTDAKTFSLFLQNLGMCSPAPYGVIYIGYTNCDTYTQAAYMVLQTVGGTGLTLPPQATVAIGAGASTPGTPNMHWASGGSILQPAFASPLAFANNNQGFTGTGPNGFRFVVNSGLPGNAYQMDVALQYNGTVFARGNLIRR